MLFRDIKFKTGQVHNVTLAEVHLPVRLGHRDAKKLFVAPLQAQMAAAGVGGVHEASLRTRADGDVIGVDLFLGLKNCSGTTLKTVASMLEELSAPCGSSIRLTDAPGTPLIFGRTEGLELSIENKTTPNAETRRMLVETCRDAIEDISVNRGWAEKEGRTRFFFYSEDFSAMKSELVRVLKEHPQFRDAALRRLA